MNLTWKKSESYLSSFWKSWSCLNILITVSVNGLESPNIRPNSDRNVQLKFSQRSDCFSANIQTLIFHEGHFKNMKNNRKLKLNSCCLNMCSQGNMLCIVWFSVCTILCKSCMYCCMLKWKKILIQAMPCFYGELLPTGIFSKPRPLRKGWIPFHNFVLISPM